MPSLVARHNILSDPAVGEGDLGVPALTGEAENQVLRHSGRTRRLLHDWFGACAALRPPAVRSRVAGWVEGRAVLDPWHNPAATWNAMPAIEATLRAIAPANIEAYAAYPS
jgi:hypothetical protein